MSTVYPWRDRQKAEREAIDWIVRLNSGHLSADGRARFETWRRADAAHAQAFTDVASTWQEFKQAGGIVRTVSFGAAMDTAAQAYPKPLYRRPLLLAAAASILVAAAAVWLLGLAPEREFRTGIGEHATVQLPDGSTLELNSGSVAKVEYSEAARTIRLERGEAFFSVANGDHRPFWTVAGGAWVRAVGTAFNVHLRANDVRVVVSEGRVKVAGGQGADEPSDAALDASPVSILKAGQAAQLMGATADIHALTSEELAQLTAWRQGKVQFDNTPLGVAVAEMNRYTPVRIELKDSDLSALPVGGTFDANPQGAQALLDLLEHGMGIRIVRDRDRRAVIEGGKSP
jgi:transmembrane sensor